MTIHGQDLSDVWTPKLVADRLIEAVRWARYNAGRTGPAGVKAAALGYLPSDDDFAVEGWGQREKAEEEEKAPQRRYSPAKVSLLISALDWPGKYLVPADAQTSAEILHLWLRCKVYRRNFEDAIEGRARPISRASAYRYRDRALSIIAQGLTNDGVPV